MVGAGEQLSRSHSGDGAESSGLLATAVRRPLQHVHQVGDEEVILQCRHTFLRQDGGLAAHWARQCYAVSWDVILQAPGEREEERGGASYSYDKENHSMVCLHKMILQNDSKDKSTISSALI